MGRGVWRAVESPAPPRRIGGGSGGPRRPGGRGHTGRPLDPHTRPRGRSSSAASTTACRGSRGSGATWPRCGGTEAPAPTRRGRRRAARASCWRSSVSLVSRASARSSWRGCRRSRLQEVKQWPSIVSGIMSKAHALVATVRGEAWRRAQYCDWLLGVRRQLGQPVQLQGQLRLPLMSPWRGMKP